MIDLRLVRSEDRKNNGHWVKMWNEIRYSLLNQKKKFLK